MTTEITKRIDGLRHGYIPEGYKKTTAGIVPQEWDIKSLSNICEINPNRDNEVLGQVTFVGMADTDENGRIIAQKIVEYAKVQSGFTPFRRGDILIAKITPCFENGKGGWTEELLTKNGFGSTEFHVLRSHVHSKFLFYHTVSNSFRKRLEREMVGSAGQKRVQAGSIANYYIPVPTMEEQRKIAAILTTQDKVIGLKEKLLAEKQRQKKRLMQQLLTGKKRLPGFDCEWHKVRLSDTLHEINERTTQNNQYDILSVTKNGIVKQAEHFNKQVASEDNIGYKVLRRGNLAFSTMNLWMGSLDILDMFDIGIISPAYKVFRINEQEFYIPFAKQFIKSEAMIRQYNIHSEQGASIVRRNLDLQALMSIRIKLPSLAEQSAIATILSTADREISLLQESITAEKAKKKALMQLLLTGIVRVNVNTQD